MPSTRTRVLAACTIGNAISTTPAVHAVFGVFLVPLAETFGWPRASISVVLGIVALAGAIVYPLAGRYADRHGARHMVIASSILFALSIATLALSTGSLAQFYLSFALIGTFGAAAGTPIFSKVVTDWFQEKRGTALGISAGVGSGVGSVAMPVIAAMLVSSQGWRAGYIGIALAVLVIGVPIFLLLLRDVPRQATVAQVAVVGEGLALGEAMRLSSFWLILVAIALGAGCTTAIFSHVVPILGDRGFAVSTGTAVVGGFALVGSTWQIATGRLLDWTKGPRVVIPMYLMAVVGLALLQFAPTTSGLMLGGVLLGVGLGTQFGALPFLIARYFGPAHFGTIIGVMYSAVILAQGVTPVLLDAGFDAMGSYRAGVIVVGACLTLCAGLLVMLPGYRVARPADDLLVLGIG